MVKKISFMIVSIMLLICLSSCRQTYTYEFLYDEDSISSIDIVYITSDENELNLEYLKQISDHDLFMQDFKALKFQKYLYVDQPTIYGKVGVKITYETDDYEIITYDAQEVFFAVDQTSRISRFYIEKDDFEKFLELYNIEFQID